MPDIHRSELRIRYDQHTEVKLPRPFAIVGCGCDLCDAGVLALYTGDLSEWQRQCQRYCRALRGDSSTLPATIGCSSIRGHVAHELLREGPILSAERTAASSGPRSATARADRDC